MGGACSTHVEDEIFMEGFSLKTWRAEITREI